MSLLALDALAGMAVRELDLAGIPSILVKGPVTAAWLYGDVREHVYTDVDVLISPEQVGGASRVFASLGWRDHHAGVLGIYRPAHERAWVSALGVVDLHTGLTGIPAQRRRDAWDAFMADSQDFSLHQTSFRSLSEPARVMHLALHASQRQSGQKALADLDRGLVQLPAETWEAAWHLADYLGAGSAFASGVRRHARGSKLLADLGAAPHASTSTVLHERGAPFEAIAIAQLGEQPRSERLGIVMGWLSVDDKDLPWLRLWWLRLRALSRLPRGMTQWQSARRAASGKRP
jgi:hypothetical protein